jgi:hypothetical protein
MISVLRPRSTARSTASVSSCSSATPGAEELSGLDLGPMSTGGVNLFHIRDSKVTRLVIYWDVDRALADLGLAAEADAADVPD